MSEVFKFDIDHKKGRKYRTRLATTYDIIVAKYERSVYS